MNATAQRRIPALVHIGGFPSSGTDLLSNFMSAHPDIHVRGEFPMLHKLARDFGPTVPAAQVPEVVARLRKGDVYGGLLQDDPAPADLVSLGDGVTLASIYAALLTQRDVLWCGNKTPQNTEHIDALLHIFPESRIVFIARDIRDVCLSWQRKWGKDMYLCAAKWNARMAKGLATMERLPGHQVLQLRYEDLTSHPQETGTAICSFLGLPFSDNFLSYQEHVNRVVDGKRNFGAALDPGNAGKWRQQLDEATVRRIEEIALPAMELLGYRPEFAHRARPLTAGEVVRGLATDSVAALTVGNRYKNRNRLRDRLRRVAISIRYRAPSL